MAIKKDVEQEVVKKEVKPETLVVAELPKYPTRQIKDAEGNQFDLLTIDEAITEIYKDVKQILAALK